MRILRGSAARVTHSIAEDILGDYPIDRSRGSAPSATWLSARPQAGIYLDILRGPSLWRVFEAAFRMLPRLRSIR